MFSELVESRSPEAGCRWVVCLALVFASGRFRAHGQAAVAPQGGATSNISQIESAGDGPGRTYTMRVSTHEVIVDVVALGPHNRTIGDLKKEEFQIFEVGTGPKGPLRNVVSFRAVDPALEQGSEGRESDGFGVKATGGCAMTFTRHYRLAFNPTAEGSTSGTHEFAVTTGRPHVILSYNPEYYVGVVGAQARQTLRNDTADEALHQAACGGHLEVPPSIALNAHLIRTADSDPFRISVAVQPDSLPFLSMANGTRQVHLDYGACEFDAAGKALTFVNQRVERVLPADDYAHAMVSGFTNLVELPRMAGTAMVRFVVLDRGTGNLGSIDVVTTAPSAQEESAGSDGATGADQTAQLNQQFQNAATELLQRGGMEEMLRGEAPGTFGSIVPGAGRMCGDVYELKEGTRRLPDYWDHPMTGDPVGAVYTDSLKVPYDFRLASPD